MLFPTVTFAVFFALVLPASWWLMPRPRLWKPFMLAASYVFYGAWDHRFVLLLSGSALANQTFAVLIRRSAGRRKTVLLASALAANLGVLAYFKYAGFLVSSVVNTLSALGIDGGRPIVDVLLPVGISFITFQALSYVIDVYRGRLDPAPTIDVALFIAFFPQIVAGPIVRAGDLLPQIAAPRDPSKVAAQRGFHLIVRGLLKKTVVAAVVSTAIVDPVFAAPGSASSLEILVAIYAYAVQIYADFSGYTDIALGVGLLLGFELPVNFDRPYAATSLQDFWRRWHISLSTWLRDYLYVALGGSRHGRLRAAGAVMVTMLLGGLWHGASWTFVVWGGLHGLGLLAERVWRDGTARSVAVSAGRLIRLARASLHAARGRLPDRPALPKLPRLPALPKLPRLPPMPTVSLGGAPAWAARALRIVITFHVVCAGWVFFRSETFSVAGELFARLATAWGPAPLVTPPVLLAVAGTLAAQFVPDGLADRVLDSFTRLSPALQGAALALALMVLDGLSPSGVAPFIYFRF